MKTARDMYQHCLDNGFGIGTTDGWAIKHFSVIEKNLKADEKVDVVFIGLNNYIGLIKKSDGSHAYAITDRRIMRGQKKLIGEKFSAILLENLHDISLKKGVLSGVLTFDTIKEVFNVKVDKRAADNILERIQDVLFTLESKNVGGETWVYNDSPADELRKFKQLLDDGIINEIEFKIKKKKLLGL